jgi:hypothetical protein
MQSNQLIANRFQAERHQDEIRQKFDFPKPESMGLDLMGIVQKTLDTAAGKLH